MPWKRTRLMARTNCRGMSRESILLSIESISASKVGLIACTIARQKEYIRTIEHYMKCAIALVVCSNVLSTFFPCARSRKMSLTLHNAM